MQTWSNNPLPPLANDEYKDIAWGVDSTTSKVKPMYVNRHKVTDFEVKIDMKYCGVCHTDMHQAHNDMGGSIYPLVPGHELVGTVIEVGPKVTKVKIGDNVGIGCMVDSCMDCKYCKKGDETFCRKGATWSYNGKRLADGGHTGGNKDTQTFGGYTATYVCYEHFVCKIPDSLALDKAAPLLCAAIAMYEPLKFHGACEGEKMTIGVVGIGGLGTMGIKIAKALGHRVVAISRTKAKEALALQKGADCLIASSDPESMKTEENKIDIILNTISTNHQAGIYIPLLATDGVLVQQGVANEDHHINQMPLMWKRAKVTGSLVGGIPNTEAVLNLCAKHNITPEIEVIKASQINEAWEKLVENKDAIRYVIDIKESLKDQSFLPE